MERFADIFSTKMSQQGQLLGAAGILAKKFKILERKLKNYLYQIQLLDSNLDGRLNLKDPDKLV